MSNGSIEGCAEGRIDGIDLALMAPSKVVKKVVLMVSMVVKKGVLMDLRWVDLRVPLWVD